MPIEELVFQISGDTRALRASLAGAQKQVGSFGKSVRALGGLIAGAFIANAIKNVTLSLVEAGSQVEETGAKFNTVFSQVSQEAAQANLDIAKGFNVSNLEAQKLLASSGDLLTGFGATQESALDLSVSINSLAGDLASFQNLQGGTADAAFRLNSAVTGETEGLKALGIVVRQDTELFRDQVAAIQEEQGVSLQLAKGIAILNEARRQSKNAIGDVLRTQASFANQTRLAQANVENFRNELGTALVPIANVVVTAFNEMSDEFLGIAESIKDFITSASGAESIGRALGNTIGFVAGVFDFISPIIDTVVDLWTDLFSAFSNLNVAGGDSTSMLTILGGVIQTIAGTARVFGSVLVGLVETIVQLVNVGVRAATVIGTIGRAISGDLSAALDLQNQIDALGEDFFKIGTIAKQAFDGVIEAAKEGFGGFGESLEENVGGAQETFNDLATVIRAKVQAALENANLAQEELGSSAEENTGKIKEFFNISEEGFDNFAEKFDTFTDGFNKTYGELAAGASALFSSLGNLATANADRQVAEIDRQLEAELAARGLSEETETEKLQRELDAALLAGDTTLAAEKERELERAQLEKEAEKRKANIQYQGALKKYKLDLAEAITTAPVAIINALNTGFGAGFPVGIVLGPLLAGLATAASIAQIATIRSNKPTRPSFAVGTFNVPRDMQADIHRGEIIAPASMSDSIRSGDAVLGTAEGLTREAQKQAGGAADITIRFQSEDGLFDRIFRASRNGTLKIDTAALVGS